MEHVAGDVWRLDESPRPLINVYLAGDVLIDAGRRWDRRRIFRQIDGREISMLALTHAHCDHQGCAKAVCEARGIPLACHADDVEAMEGRRPIAATNGRQARLYARLWAGPPRKVDRVLNEGEEIAGFRVVHAPGHSPGEVIFFRDDDRVAICGDVIRNISYLSLRARLAAPPDNLTLDPAENRRSVRRLAELDPSVILPGHGPAVTDVDRFKRWAAALPA
jgi:glyoxylase-like metal-dependent hydrolase (beta-lactamase superfamily II)